MKDHHKHRATTDRVRRQSDERRKRERWLRSRLPLDGEQEAWVQEQVRKIEERERVEQRERRNQRTDTPAPSVSPVPLPPPASAKPTATAPVKALPQRGGDMDDEIPF
jgi:hypothetical protein